MARYMKTQRNIFRMMKLSKVEMLALIKEQGDLLRKLSNMIMDNTCTYKQAVNIIKESENKWEKQT